MSLLDEPTRIFDGIVEKPQLNPNGGLSIEYTKSIEGHKYTLVTPVKNEWLNHPDIVELVRKMAKGYFDMLAAL